MGTYKRGAQSGPRSLEAQDNPPQTKGTKEVVFYPHFDQWEPGLVTHYQGDATMPDFPPNDGPVSFADVEAATVARVVEGDIEAVVSDFVQNYKIPDDSAAADVQRILRALLGPDSDDQTRIATIWA